jgi:hypothetical protein
VVLVGAADLPPSPKASSSSGNLIESCNEDIRMDKHLFHLFHISVELILLSSNILENKTVLSLRVCEFDVPFVLAERRRKLIEESE